MKEPKRVEDKFLTTMGLQGLKGKQKQKALDDILTVINWEVAKRIGNLLSEKQVAEFEQLTDDNNFSEEKLVNWMKQNVPDYEQILEDVTQELSDESKETIGRISKMGHHSAEPSF